MPTARAASEPARRRLGPQLVAAGVVGVAFGLVTALVVFGHHDRAAGANRPAVPAIAYERFAGGSATLADHRGRPMVVNFWASWCTPCAAELPELEAAHQRWGGRVAFVGLTHRDDRARARSLARRSGVTYELGDDAHGDLYRAFDLVAMPSTVFVDADGRVRAVVAGRLDERALTAQIDAILNAA